MALRINHNAASLATYGTLSATSVRMAKSVEKLSSGLRINRAADDAAGLAISEKLRRQIRGLSRAVLNAQDGISMMQSGEGALNESHGVLQRMRELAIQAASDTLTSNDRLEIQKEVRQLRDDLDRIAHNTEFNTRRLLDGSQMALFSASSGSVKGLVTGIPSAGGEYAVSLALLEAGISEMQRSHIFTTTGDGTGALAGGATQLLSITQLYDPNGVFALAEPRALTIAGNARSVSITLDGQMTLGQMAEAIERAVVTAKGLDLPNTTVRLVSPSMTQEAGWGGFLQITSGAIGEKGRLGFAADQPLLDGLGFSTTREGKDNLVEAAMKDFTGNATTVQTRSSRAIGLLDGIDLEFSSQAAQVAGTVPLQEGLSLATPDQFWVNVGNKVWPLGMPLMVDSGASTLEEIARSLNWQIDDWTTAMPAFYHEFKGLKAVVWEGEIRFEFEPQKATIPSTLSFTFDLGDNVLGFADGEYSGLMTGKKDQSREVWGFSTFNDPGSTGIADGELVQFSIGDGNAGPIAFTAYNSFYDVFAPGLEHDMVVFDTFQASLNAQLEAAGIKVRVDAIDGVMAFTSLRVGTDHLNGAAPIDSMVEFGVVGSAAFRRESPASSDCRRPRPPGVMGIRTSGCMS